MYNFVKQKFVKENLLHLLKIVYTNLKSNFFVGNCLDWYMSEVWTYIVF